MRLIAGFLGGFILAVLCALLIAVTVAASLEQAVILIATSFSICWGAGLAGALFAKSARKAWQRLLLASSVISFLLSLAGIVYTGRLITQINSDSTRAGPQATRFAIDGSLIDGILGFVGFFLGVIFLIVGLLIGRDKQVNNVQAAPDVSQSGDEKQRHDPRLK